MNNSIDRMAWSDLIKNFFAPRPRDVDGVQNQSSLHYREWCLKKLFGAYALDGMPDNWDESYIMEHLFLDGYFSITDTDLGVIPLKCGYAGINVFDHPTECIYANHVLGNFTRRIDVDCALIKLQYNYQGAGTLIQRYATMLAMADSSISVNLLNTKVAHVFGASSKAEAATMKKMYDDVSCGNPIVIINDSISKKINDSAVNFHVKENYIASDVNILKEQIKNEFLTEIGIANANTEKRERLISSEVMSNQQEVKTNAQHWLDCVNEGLAVANRLYGLNLRFRLRDFGGSKNGDIKQPETI